MVLFSHFGTGGERHGFTGRLRSISSRELEVDVRSLCGKLTRAAERYYHENAERFDFINFKIMGL